MFRACEHTERIAQIISLQTSDRGSAQTLREFRGLAEAFIGTPPTLIARNRDARRKGPVDSGRANLFRRDARSSLNQWRTARAAEPYVVREDHCPEHVAVTMHRIDAIENRNPQASLQRAALVTVVQLCPSLQAVAGFRIRTTATQ